MPILARLAAWCRARRTEQLGQLLSVEFDEIEVRVIPHGQMDAAWNHCFRWERYSFKVRLYCAKNASYLAHTQGCMRWTYVGPVRTTRPFGWSRQGRCASNL